jgi:putative chitinase
VSIAAWWKRMTAPKAADPAPPTHVVIAQPAAPAPVVTPDVLFALGWIEGQAYAEALAAPLKLDGITTPTRLAAFLAQVGHESGGGRWRREIWGPTEVQARYEGRRDLGNTQPGDGARFRGRGLIQITGRSNTEKAWHALRPDLTLQAFCQWLEGIEGAATSACWWWQAHGCNALADSGDFVALTRRINGGTNGLKDRQERWAKAKAALHA